MEEDSSIHQRVLVLRDVALGVNKNSKLNPNLTPACFDSIVDSLLALHEECSQATGLSKNTNVTNFLGKCTCNYNYMASLCGALGGCIPSYKPLNTQQENNGRLLSFSKLLHLSGCIHNTVRFLKDMYMYM